MSLFNTLSTGASGLSVCSTSLSIIGDNIANVGTTGFKSSRAHFADVFPQYLGTAGGPSKMGRGAMVGGVTTSFGQGALESTGGLLDIAIAGQGFVPVRNGEETMYTRDGAFQLDKDGYVVNLTGANVQGFQADGGVLTSQLGDLKLDLSPIAQQATTVVTLDANLTADADSDNTIDYSGLLLDGSNAADSVSDASAAADFGVSITVYDSLGLPHEVAVNFERSTGNDWTWSAVTDASTVDLDGDGVSDGEGALEVASGTVSFDTDGNPTSFTETATTVAWNWGAAAPYTFALDVGIDVAGNATEGALTQVDDVSALNRIEQDGFPPAGLVDLSVNEEGTIVGVYDNGETSDLGGFAIATFAAEQGLERSGANMFRANFQSGVGALGTPGVAGRGQVVSRVLERSTTDLEGEFIGMIQAQRSYQANAGVVRTADETLQELVNLV